MNREEQMEKNRKEWLERVKARPGYVSEEVMKKNREAWWKRVTGQSIR